MGPLRLMLVLLPALLLASAPVDAQSNLEGFGAACRANPGFFSFAVDDLDATGAEGLCGCLAEEFADYPDEDLAMLTRDLDGSATAADRTAYGDYTGLELRARDGLDRCVVAAGTVPGADMTRFDAACAASTLLGQVLGGGPAGAAQVQAGFCACLSVAIAPQVSTAEADILAADLDETATEESRQSFPGYAELAGRAGAAFDSCYADIAPAAP